MTTYTAPNVETHVAETRELPPEPTDLAGDRPDEPTPSLWQKSVTAVHKYTKEPVVVVRVDWNTNMFRPYFPERKNPDGTKGVWAPRTEWHRCEHYDVNVTFSPSELARQEAAAAFMAECEKLDPESLAAVELFCDDPDPKKNLAKLWALQKLGTVRGPTQVLAQVAEEKKAKGTK